MIEQDNEPGELGPIATELMKLARDLKEMASEPLFVPEDVANDDDPLLDIGSDRSA